MIIRIIKSYFFKKAQEQAKKLRKNKKGKEATVNEAEEKIGKFAKAKGKFSQFFKDLSLILRMLKAYVSGDYKRLPWSAAFRLFTGIIYFVAIIDFIPDFIPIFGFLDDIAVIGWVLSGVKVEAEHFLQWEIEQKVTKLEHQLEPKTKAEKIEAKSAH